MRTLFAVLLLSSFNALAADLSRLELGEIRAQAARGELLYVAPATGGVVVVDLSDPAAPKVAGRFAAGRFVSRILLTADSIVLFETHEEATLWSLADPRAPSRSTAPPAALAEGGEPVKATSPAPLPLARARVLQVRGGRVIFDAGSKDGFVAGRHVRIAAQRLERKPDLATGGVVNVPSGEITAVVRLEDAQVDRSMARLGRGDVAEVGDLAELSDEPLSERLFVPRRSPFTVVAGFHARPFLGLEATTQGGASSKPVGFLLDAHATWYVPGWPVAIDASVAPVGFSLGASESHFPIAFSVTAAYATDWFEIGLGAGGLRGNAGPCMVVSGPDPTCEVNTGLTINQVLRLGAIDGINATWRSSIFSRPDRFVFGVGRAEANFPLTRQLALFGGGGAGENGWSFGELGVRTYVGGLGARGTVILSASIGYAAIFDGPSRETVGGPSVAFGAEWRL